MIRKSFKTAKGADLALLDLKGKEYLQVAQRIQWMREEHQNWTIRSRIVKTDDKETIFEAEILDENGKLIANAHKSETKADFKDHLEKAQTSAIGRALALCGYGTQFCADDLDEGTRLADSPVSNQSKENGVYRVPFGKKYNGMTLDEIGSHDVEGYMNYLISSSDKEGKPLSHQGKEFIERAKAFLSTWESETDRLGRE
jgi:hypothetical protein